MITIIIKGKKQEVKDFEEAWELIKRNRRGLNENKDQRRF